MIDNLTHIVFNYFETIDLLLDNNDKKLATKPEGLKYLR